jgi:tetratricopeptide (TPR) repeat protein
MRIKIIVVLFLFVSTHVDGQGKLKGLGDKLRDINPITKKMDKMREDYDDSNFNYAISFLDNSALFESEEKGNALTTGAFSGPMFNGQQSGENLAYNNMRQGEMLMASNRNYLAEQSFKRSEDYFVRAEKIFGNTTYAQVISDLGLLYQNKGLYAKAMPYCDSAITLRSSLESKIMLAVSYNNKGVLLKDMGNYTEAESYVKKAYKLLDEQKDDLGRALTLNNLAMIYVDMNKLKDAEKSMDSSMARAKSVLKENSSNYIKLDINLAQIYRLQKKYTQAEEVFKKAIEIKEKKLGVHPDIAHLKSGLAQLYIEMENYKDVERLLQSAHDINKRKLGDKHPLTVKILQEQANYYRIVGENAEALTMINKVLDQKKELYGESHPSYLQALEQKAIIQWNLKDISGAKASFQIVLDNTRNYITKYFNTLNDNEKNLYWEKTQNMLQRYYAFVQDNYKTDADLKNQMLNTVITTKGFLLNGSSKLRNSILSSDDAELKKLYTKWLDTKENLNNAYQLSKEELAQEKINLDSLQKKEDEYERELSKKSSLFDESNGPGITSYGAIQQTLKPGEAAIEIVQVNEYKNKLTGRSSYVALVLKNSSLDVVELGLADTINNSIGIFRANIIDQKPELNIFPVVWKAVDSSLTGISKAYFSLDGAFHQLAINAIKDNSGKYILDKYAIQFVGNIKDIISVKKDEDKHEKPKTAFLIGNPFYGKHDLIPQLPGAEKEVKSVTATLKSLNLITTTLYGKEATETKIKAIKSPDILHIATHGYFLADVSKMETNKVLGVDIAVAKENPLLRSGLLLANCDNVFDENYHASGPDNGVLTAYEALTLNLDKTDLVVLSACETGLGSVKQGEGVYGLQRAFLIAGAKSIVMSLWSVSDEATMELMTNFYSNYAKTGNKQQSFADAQKKLKVKYKDPFYWSAFIMLNI